MKLSDMRLRIFILWLVFALIVTALPLAGLRDGAMVMSQVKDVMTTVITLWLPVLVCFGAFWFNPTTVDEAKELSPGKGRVIAAFAFTGFYMLLASGLIAIEVFTDPIDSQVIPPNEQTLQARVAETVKLVQLLSPVLLTPIAYLTGKAPEPTPAPPI